ncbi:TRAP transporter small permease subunit [Roseisalinus antarcticus]|uniref:TRAP transporter small permease protein n=1 Tax=Roseisalinus antarcticus TaxID=254357 RepID=A0A1Y5TJA5_9RHOB|nr:TRAP transporter small permease [Roseisalinus antarcticus]SLN61736.1 2,3-diketo-L-gulonate TRAP transporter small permease protein YiaM [Roseisalinus antarcticus]
MKRTLELVSIAAGAALPGLAFLTAVEVLLRKVFDHSLAGVDEIGGYVYAIVSAVGFIAAYSANAYIRVDLVLSRVGRLPRLAVNILSHLALAAFAGLLTWRATAQWLRSWELGALAPTPLRTPLVIPQGIWLVLLAAFTATILWRLGSVLYLLSRGRVDAAGKLVEIAGARSQTAAEIEAARVRQSGREPPR